LVLWFNDNSYGGRPKRRGKVKITKAPSTLVAAPGKFAEIRRRSSIESLGKGKASREEKNQIRGGGLTERESRSSSAPKGPIGKRKN